MTVRSVRAAICPWLSPLLGVFTWRSTLAIRAVFCCAVLAFWSSAQPARADAAPRAAASGTAGASAKPASAAATSKASAKKAPAALRAASGTAGADAKPASAAATSKPIAKKAPTEIPFILRPAPKISVLTFGPGDAAFLKFGHNAVRVQNPEDNSDLVYNFGTFNFDHPLLILDFLRGKFRYWVSVTTFRQTVAYYGRFDREVIEQELNVGHQGAHDIKNALVENAKPENRFYVYDYYRDNCSTRVRDVIDLGIHDAIKTRSQDAAELTLRDHTLRAVADDFWLYLGLDIAMGSYIDQPEKRYGEMFLPEKLHDGLERIVFSGVHGTATLVKERKVWYKATSRNKLYRRPPERTLSFLKGGLTLGAFLGFLGWEAYRRRRVWAKTLLCLLMFVFGVAAGTLGCLFVALWSFTDHVVAHKNENILQCAPWGLLLAACVWGVFREQAKWIERAYKLALGAAVLAAAGLLLKGLPGVTQQNYRIIALLLPTWGGLLFALSLMRLRSQHPLLIPIAAGDKEPLPERDENDDEEPKSTRPPAPVHEEDEDEDEDAPASAPGEPVPA